MSDPIYVKLRHSGLEIDLMRRLVKAIKALEKIEHRNVHKTTRVLSSRASAYEFAKLYENQLQASEQFAGQTSSELTDNLDDEAWDLMFCIRHGKI